MKTEKEIKNFLKNLKQELAAAKKHYRYQRSYSQGWIDSLWWVVGNDLNIKKKNGNESSDQPGMDL